MCKRRPCFPRESGKSEHMQLGKGWVGEKSKREKEEERKQNRQHTDRHATGHEGETRVALTRLTHTIESNSSETDTVHTSVSVRL